MECLSPFGWIGILSLLCQGINSYNALALSPLAGVAAIDIQQSARIIVKVLRDAGSL
ncbi:MAG TPA: hypothetical protein VKB86_04905 [Pyrinomonadaceae bacterium]|nr:hypothetical protein [Pyrinomonadaceae bacterium]